MLAKSRNTTPAALLLETVETVLRAQCQSSVQAFFLIRYLCVNIVQSCSVSVLHVLAHGRSNVSALEEGPCKSLGVGRKSMYKGSMGELVAFGSKIETAINNTTSLHDLLCFFF